MILAVDVGNTNVVLGLIRGGQIAGVRRLATRRDATGFEYAMSIRDVLEGVGLRSIRGGIISSVVPPATRAIKEAFTLLTGLEPIVVGPGIRTDMPVLTDNPAAVGADRIVDAVAARELEAPPVIVLDMGTANTFSVVNSDGAFAGGVIMPGLRLNMDALTHSTSLLPQVSLDRPSRVIGRNTAESMRSGLLYGCASAIDGVIARIRGELGRDCPVVVTGGLSALVVPLCREKLRHEPGLLLQGLAILYEKNAVKQR